MAKETITSGAGVLWSAIVTMLNNMFTELYLIFTGKSGGQTIIGGTAITDPLNLQGTSGNGTLTSPAIVLKVGNNGATAAATVLNSGNMGVGLSLPLVPFHIVKTAPTLPGVSGSTPTGLFRIANTAELVADFGLSNVDPYGFWIQATRKSDFSVHDPILLQPNGGSVGVGTAVPTERLDVRGNGYFSGRLAVGRSALGIMGTFEGTVTNDTNRDGIIVTTKTIASESGYHDIFGLSSQITDQTINSGIADTGLRVALTGDAYSQLAAFVGSLDTQIGVRGTAGFAVATAGATVTNAIGGNFSVRNEQAGVTITNAYGVKISNSGTTGTITNRYDLYAGSANAKSYFAGTVGIGSTAPTSPLQVVGIPVYANNAAAIAGGLTAGAFYRTGADPDPLMIVH